VPKCTPVRNVGSVILGRMLVISVQPKRYNFRRQKSFQSSRNPKDVPSVHESWLGMYGLGTTAHRRRTFHHKHNTMFADLWKHKKCCGKVDHG